MHTSQTNSGIGELGGTAPESASVTLLSPGLSPWCRSRGKRALDLVAASGLLLVTFPLMVLAALAVKLSSPGPVLFRQKRVGRNGRLFELMKFRSMHAAAGPGPGLTADNDPRVSSVGRVLRKWKIDELPQLFNVIRGDMSLVGPRPDLPEFCATLAGEQRQVLELDPGITGAATLIYRHEERILAGRGRDNISDYYVNQIYPDKVQVDLDYARKASLSGDLRILLRTFSAILVAPKTHDHEQVSR